MAGYDQDGNIEMNNTFPWALRFSPTGEYSFPATKAEGYTSWIEDLKSIPSGSVLYDVYATDKPVELGGTESKIGQIKTTSALDTSNWGDEHLYFRHERMDRDLSLKPEWVPYTPKYEGIFSLAQQEDGTKCPFADLINYLQ